MRLVLLALALSLALPASAWDMPGMWQTMRWGRGNMPMMQHRCKAAREGNSVVLSGLKFEGGEMMGAQLPRHPETWEQMRDMMARVMGGDAGAQAAQLQCEKYMDGDALKVKMATPEGCRSGRMAVWCQDCMMGGQKITKRLSSEPLAAPMKGRDADGTALVLVLRGATLQA